MNKKMFEKVLLACTGFLLFVATMATLLQNGKNYIQPTVALQKEKVIYLTFDDGPSRNTEKILDILDEYKVKATFFVTGIDQDYVSMIKEEAKRGHAIGVHTYSHDYKQIYSSVEAYFKDLELANQMIEQQTGSKATILRFPGGSSNTISSKYKSGIMSELAKKVIEQGFSYYDWNAESGDGNSKLSAKTLIRNAHNSVKGKDNVMMLMHDGGGNNATVKALPEILKDLKSQGYVFKVIDSSTPVFHHHISN